MRRIWICALVSCVGPSCLYAQSLSSETYVDVSAGIAIEPAEFSVRSNFGPTLAVAMGRKTSAHVAIEARVTAARFAAPDQFISPAGCFGAYPCYPPVPSVVQALTIGGSAVYEVSAGPATPFVNVGGGMRRLVQTAQGTEVRPYAELGAGIRSGTLSVEARVQLASSSHDFARWMSPVGVGFRF